LYTIQFQRRFEPEKKTGRSMPVRRVQEKNESFTRLNVFGHVLEEDMHEALEEFYQNQPTQLLLYDMALAQVWHITPDMVLRFVQHAVRLGVSRPGGRTAVIAPEDLVFDLGMLSQAFHDLETRNIALRIFRTEDEALTWLTTEPVNGD
jgi:hypothetical protein